MGSEMCIRDRVLLTVPMSQAWGLVVREGFVEAFYIPVNSMYPTVCRGDRVLADKRILRFESLRRGDLIILRSDLTNKMGYESREWHLKAPNLEEDAAKWIAQQEPAGVCLDFPQDYIAREMPTRHVYNHEFVAHHAIFSADLPFIEDLKDLGVAKEALLQLRLEQTLQPRFDIVDDVVDDRVVADLHTVAPRELARLRICPHVETKDHGA